MTTRRDFTGLAARTRGDTWQITLPFASGVSAVGVEIAMALRRHFEDSPVYFVITNATDAVEVDEATRDVRFKFSRGMTGLLDAGHVWYDAKAYDPATDELLTHWYGQIQVLPTGDLGTDGVPDPSPDVQYGSDAAHGQRGGGLLHPLATDDEAGFFSPEEKQKLAALDLSEGGAVASVFGRVGVVSAAEGDYAATQIVNDSNTPLGVTVAEAFETIYSATITFAQMGADHAADHGNPHAVTKAQLALGNVTDDAQLKRSAGDFAAFGIKPTPLGTDVLLLEDSARDGAKASATVEQLITHTSDEQHGDRGGGALHADAIAGGASGFFSGAAALKLAGIAAGATVALVTSVFGRTGAVVAAASDVANDSTVVGATVKLALETNKAALLTHTSDVSNPHALTKTQIALGNVSNDAQLTRGAGDFALFTAKPAPVMGDVLLIEDSAAAGAKKRATAVQLVTGALNGGTLAFVGAGASSATDLLSGSNSTPLQVIQQRNDGTLRVATNTLTANTNPALKSTATWNNAALAFSGWELDVTNTASLASSKLLDLKTGGVSQFSVSPAGSGSFAGNLTIAGGLTHAGTTMSMTHGNGGFINGTGGLFLSSPTAITITATSGAAIQIRAQIPNTVTPILDIGPSLPWTHAAGIAVALSVTPTANQSGTAGYTLLKIDATHTAVGTGAKNLILASVGGAIKFGVSSSGLATAAGGLDVSGVGAGASALTFVATSDVPATTWTAGTPSNNPAGYMRCTAGAVTRYIPYWT